jgi:adenylate cyclase
MAIGMQRRMRELQLVWRNLGSEKPFQLRIGGQYGLLYRRQFGSEDRMDYTIIGKEVNLAARLQSRAELGGIVVAHDRRPYFRIRS